METLSLSLQDISNTSNDLSRSFNLKLDIQDRRLNGLESDVKSLNSGLNGLRQDILTSISEQNKYLVEQLTAFAEQISSAALSTPGSSNNEFTFTFTVTEFSKVSKDPEKLVIESDVWNLGPGRPSVVCRVCFPVGRGEMFVSLLPVKREENDNEAVSESVISGAEMIIATATILRQVGTGQDWELGSQEEEMGQEEEEEGWRMEWVASYLNLRAITRRGFLMDDQVVLKFDICVQ